MIRRSFAVTLFGLAALLVSDVASAQRVVILEFEGDRRDRVRTQIVRELIAANEVELVPIKEFKQIAAEKGFRGSRAMTSDAVAEVSRELPFSVAIEGSVGRQFRVRILDAAGAELWKKDNLPLKRGALSSKNAGRLAKAITAAARAVPPPKPPEPEPEEEEAEAPTETTEEEEETTQLPGMDVSQPEETEEERERRLREERSESHTVRGEEAVRRAEEMTRDEDLDAEGRKKKRAAVGPKLVTVALGGTTTWRAYCSRPGVQSCAEYDARPEGERPAGDTVDFSPQVPYAGFGVSLDFFPLASFDNPANGIGASVAFSRGFSLTNVRVQTPGGEQPEQQVISIDDSWHAFGVYRYYFGYGDPKTPLIGYVGIRGGVAARTFEVDPTARVPLPGSHRRYPAFGLELSIPIVRIFRVEGGGLYFLNPKAGPDEIAGYGSDARGSGFMAEAGIGGEIWGPVGYTVKLRLNSYKDIFTGQGNKWANGGVAEETYTGLFWGITAGF